MVCKLPIGTKMGDQPGRTALSALIELLDASVWDIASGALSDAGDVQVEVRRMLADYESAQPAAGRPSGSAKRAGTA